ncbi:hypothetical protein [Variovorax sp. PvP013]|uniref:hypothetical protein n=1 Tax=Variovorax sp. PvP013 TaxID=3156435 RepID=UPI003D226938
MSRAAAAPSTAAMPHVDAAADDVGVLVRSCAEATLAHIDASVDELGQAGALLGDAMAVLRASFAAALAADAEARAAAAAPVDIDAAAAATDPDACRRHLEAAMVALQCEDALLQMLESLRRRSLQAGEALRCAVVPGPGPEPGLAVCDPAATPVDERAARARTASRLHRAVAALDASAKRAGPVRQQRAVVGTVELF